MEWTDSRSVWSETFDEQHRELVRMSSCLVTAIKEQVCKYIIRDVILFLEEHSAVHCREEERYMQLSSYPEYLQHKAQHEKFAADIIELKKAMLNLDPTRKCASYELSVETNRVIIDWGLSHIEEADKKLGDFLREEV